MGILDTLFDILAGSGDASSASGECCVISDSDIPSYGLLREVIARQTGLSVGQNSKFNKVLSSPVLPSKISSINSAT